MASLKKDLLNFYHYIIIFKDYNCKAPALKLHKIEKSGDSGLLLHRMDKIPELSGLLMHIVSKNQTY